MQKVRTQGNTKVCKSGKANNQQTRQNQGPTFDLASIMEIPGPKKPRNAYMFYVT